MLCISVALCVYIMLMEGPCLSSIPGEFYGKNSEDGIQLKNSELWEPAKRNVPKQTSDPGLTLTTGEGRHRGPLKTDSYMSRIS